LVRLLSLLFTRVFSFTFNRDVFVFYFVFLFFFFIQNLSPSHHTFSFPLRTHDSQRTHQHRAPRAVHTGRRRFAEHVRVQTETQRATAIRVHGRAYHQGNVTINAGRVIYTRAQVRKHRRTRASRRRSSTVQPIPVASCMVV